MRFSPPPSLRIGEGSGGLNQISVRSFNERLVMSLLLQHNGMSRLELGRISGLSAQTISVIVRWLERDGMILRGEAQRGRVGPPTIPMNLNPEGAFSVGADVGPHSVDVVLIDFIGNIHYKSTIYLEAARIDHVIEALDQLVPEALAQIEKKHAKRIAGIGLTLPPDFDQWPGLESASNGPFDFEQHLHRLTGQEVFIQDAVTAAVGAVSMFERPHLDGDYLFCLIGPQIATRLVLDHRVYVGAVAGTNADAAGIIGLGQKITQSTSSVEIWKRSTDWSTIGDALDLWIDDCASELCETLLDLQRFLNARHMIVTSSAPVDVCTAVCVSAQAKLDASADNKDKSLSIRPSMLGNWITAVGAARLPFHSRFMVQG